VIDRTDELLRRLQDLTHLANLRRKLGRTDEANAALERAAAVSLAYLAASDQERVIGERTARVSGIFAELAWQYAQAGQPGRALAATEAVRGLALRLYTMTDREKAGVRLEALAPLGPRPVTRFEDGEWRMTLTREPDPVSEQLELPDVSGSLGLLRDKLADVPTAIVSICGTPGRGMTAVLGYPDGTLASVQWTLDPGLPEVSPGYDTPGPFRERRLRHLSTAFYAAFFGPVDQALDGRGIARIALSMPFWISRFPVEALSAGPDYIADRYQILYLPSLTVAADLAAPEPAAARPRALIVSYAGDDLPHSMTELTSLRELWGDQTTVMSGAESGKAAILAELGGQYDIVHFSCHATYDEEYPLRSALHLVPDPLDDRHRLSAWDIMSQVRFPRAPVVSLSACSSGIMDSSDTNSCYGLAGSFLRAGARSVIGARWPVYDDTAEQTVVGMYRMQHGTELTTSQCLHAVGAQLRSTAGIEDWAAFGCFGLS
jgi:hypothetical protein